MLAVTKAEIEKELGKVLTECKTILESEETTTDQLLNKLIEITSDISSHLEKAKSENPKTNKAISKLRIFTGYFSKVQKVSSDSPAELINISK